MAKPSADDIAKQLKKQNDDAYGDDYVDGDHDKFDDTKEMLKDAIGNSPDNGESFSIYDEIDKDEEGLESIPLEDFDTDNELKDLDAEDILKEDDVVSLNDLGAPEDNDFDDYEE